MIVKSQYSVAETLDRLSTALEDKGVTVFARINHAAGAEKIGETLRPTELMIFGNPKLGTPLMKANQEVGFDLPLKALCWEDASGEVHLKVTEPALLKSNYGLETVDEVIAQMKTALTNFTKAASEAS